MSVKHVALITASIEALDPDTGDESTLRRFRLRVLEVRPIHEIVVTVANESAAIERAKDRIASALALSLQRTQAVTITPPDGEAFAESLSKLGDESVVPLDGDAAPTDRPPAPEDNEAGTPE